jgi:large subunit ribosomal protein L25
LASGENVILDLQIKSEKGTESKKAMLKEVQIDPVSDAYLHADFYEISMDREIMVNIPVHLVGTPIGVTNGGILQHIRRELSITCLPDKLVDFLELDVTELDIGDSLHLEDIEFPEGITPDEEGHLTVVVVAAPTVEEEVVEEEEELEGEEAEEAGEEGATEEAAEEASTEEK